MNIIGISGYPRSGKDTVGELLIEHGYYGFSFGDVIRRYARKRHKDEPDPISVKNMTETANWLRDDKGPDIVLQEALDAFEADQKKGNNYKGMVFISVRAPVEADFVLEHGGQLIWVEVDDRVRYKRDKMARREGEIDVSFEEFKRQESLQDKPQTGVPTEAQMSMPYVKSKATLILYNNGNDIEAFKKEVKKALKLG